METQSALYSLAGLVITTQSAVIGVLWGKLLAMQKELQVMGLRLDVQSKAEGYAEAMSHTVKSCPGGTPCPLSGTFSLAP